MRSFAESASLLLVLALYSSGFVAQPLAHGFNDGVAQQTRSRRKSRKRVKPRLFLNGRPFIDSQQVLNSKAIVLPEPEYPPEARRRGITGTVKVEVLVSGLGEMISAKAIRGPKLLRAAAEDAALRAKLSATMNGHWPDLIVRGFLVYKFPPKP